MKCEDCNHKLTDRTSLIRGRGAKCFARHCLEHPEDAMTGYTWKQLNDYECIVVSPAGIPYAVRVKPFTFCDCVAFNRNKRVDCKHIVYALGKIADAKPRMSDEAVRKMIEEDFR